MRFLLWTFFALLILACLYFAWKPSPFIRDVPGVGAALGWLDRYDDARTAVPFVLLGFLATWAAAGRRRVFWGAVGALAALSVILELGQLFIATRNFTLADILFGWLGIAVGVGGALIAQRVVVWTKARGTANGRECT